MNLAPLDQAAILEQARAGEPAIIARLLNYKLHPLGVDAQVTWQDRCLCVALVGEGASLPQPSAVTIIERGLKKLQVPGLSTVAIAAYQRGQPQPLWRDHLSLASTALAIDLAAWLDSGTSLRDAVVALPTSMGVMDLAPLTPPEVEQKYLCFQLGLENPALLPVESIQEILHMAIAHVLPVPDMPDAVLGIYNWRGEMLWVIDLNHLLNLGGLDLAALSTVTVIVLEVAGRTLGLMVQTVEEITSYLPSLLQPPTGLFSPDLEPYITGYLRETSSIVFNPEAIFNAPSLQQR